MFDKKILQPKKKRSKYGNHKCEWRGMRFDSIKEKKYAFYLESEKQQGNILSWEREKRFKLFVNDKLICTIKPDFYIIKKDGSFEAHEVKSKPTKTDLWRVKSNLFKACYPEINYVLIE